MALRWPSVQEVLWASGGVLLAFGIVLSFAPGVVPSGVVEFADALESQVDPWVIVLALSVVVFLYALYRLVRSSPDPIERLVDEASTANVPDFEDDAVDFDPERPGREFDYALARTVRLLERDPNAKAWQASAVRETLRESVIAVRVDVDVDRDAVEATIDDGSWTDDVVAANFLGGVDAPDVSLWRRLYAWFYPARALERRVERVVTEIEKQAAVDAMAHARVTEATAASDDDSADVSTDPDSADASTASLGSGTAASEGSAGGDGGGPDDGEVAP